MKQIAQIQYTEPTVTLLHATPLVNGELAARTCYNSFESSEHSSVRIYDGTPVAEINHSELLDTLCHVHFHESVIEHINLTFSISNTSRGVLQEIVRHRVASYSVKSTRYTMQNILHAFNACTRSTTTPRLDTFIDILTAQKVFILEGTACTLEIEQLFSKLHYHLRTLGKEDFLALSTSKEAKELLQSFDSNMTPLDMYNRLIECKAKRNVGDPFKWIVTDNWATDLVLTMNLRSLKNFLKLRDSGAAYEGIRWVAQAIENTIPQRYLSIIAKNNTKG